MKFVVSAVVMGVLLSSAIALSVYSGEGASERMVTDMTGRNKVEIVLTEDGFEPRDVRISKGATVIFSTTRDNQFWPASNIHPSHSIYAEFDPRRPINPDEEWSFTFKKSGTWGMHDHVRSYFTGTIYVSE